MRRAAPATPSALGLRLGLLAIALIALPAAGLDPPHDATRAVECATCHTPHHAEGGTITSVAGNANLCLACHVSGGTASAKPFSSTDQALPWPGLPSGTNPAGSSHRWDSGPAGHVASAATNTSTGSVQSGGAFTGRYPKTYTLTIATAGATGAARFSWSATIPGGGSGSNLLTGIDVSLNEGVTVSFADGPGTPFQVGDRWYVYVRTDLNAPSTAALAARTENGKLMCSTCHNQHNQVRQPFDPTAPVYGGQGTGAGRHFQRATNSTDQMCKDCHGARNVATAAGGSHPVGVSIPVGQYQNPSTLPLDAVGGQVQCESCHKPHYSATNDGTLLRQTNLAALCTECHTLADTASPAAHFGAAGVLWPGGQYGTAFPQVTDSGRRGACTNCHQPHGWPDSSNVAQDYATLLVEREESLCYTCHDANPAAKNVRAQFLKTYRHPAPDFSGRHAPAEAGNPAAYGTANRHAECVDCHNSHQARSDASAPLAPQASNRIRGVGRVTVTNGPAGSVPSYTFRDAADATAPVAEYQICFKCHSSWTTQPSGQTDQALALNVNNPSFHPVEGQGRNSGIAAGSFVNGWTWSLSTYCTDCHSSDDAGVRGPHGSAYSRLLRAPYSATSERLDNEMASSEVCFRCHNYDTYTNRDASTTVKQYSRFYNGDKGHTFHVGDRRYSCYACHQTHGSTTLEHLLVTGRSPGIISFTHTANGGTCSPTCHDPESYTVTY